MIFLLLLSHFACAEIIVQGDAVQGQALTVLVVDDVSRPVSAETVRVTMHAGMPTEAEWTLGITDIDGRVTFTPQQGGPFVVQIGEQTKRIQAKWQGIPPLALMYWLLLGGCLGIFGVWTKFVSPKR